MLQDVKEKVIRFGVSIPTLLGVIGNLKRCGHFQPPPTPYRVKDYWINTYEVEECRSKIENKVKSTRKIIVLKVLYVVSTYIE